MLMSYIIFKLCLMVSEIVSEPKMKFLLLLSVSATAISLTEYENGLLDDLTEWNPSWKKGFT